jgi:photosystem II stability/assembly factor-like uncharacterized protein
MKTRVLGLGLVGLFALVLAACGGSTPSTKAGQSLRTSTTVKETTTAPTTRPPSTTVPSAPAIPQPVKVESVTFVSTQMGWVLGAASCPPTATLCGPVLLRTDNGGQSWSPVPAPHDLTVNQVRFANADDGWMWDAGGGPDGLWSTHDGGLHWGQPALPISPQQGYISAIEASGGVVYATVNSGPVRILSSPIGRDAWNLSPTTIPLGAGPVPGEQIVLQGHSGWIVEVDRIVIGGARLVDGSWQPWTPPCAQAGGPVELTAPDALHLAAYCDGGLWSDTTDVSLDTSSDGGSTFQSRTLSFPLSAAGPIASPSTGLVLLGDNENDSLMASNNAGQSWTAVYRGQATSGWQYVGFTSPEQGVAIDGGTLLMTFDGGGTWSPITLVT